MNDAAAHTFVEQVRAYGAFVRGASSLALGERLAAARRHLLALYRAAIDLPAQDDLETVRGAVRAQRPDDWPGFDSRSLSDDLLEVLLDVESALALWDRGHHADAVWHWRFLFDTHWGEHAIDALRALHRACKPPS